MIEDKFAKELRDKMDYGISRLSPAASELYFLLTSAFLSLGRKNQIKISLQNIAKDLNIKSKNQSDIKSIIENAFSEIHKNTFVKYQFSFNQAQNSSQEELYISSIDNSEENSGLIKRAFLNKDNMS